MRPTNMLLTHNIILEKNKAKNKTKKNKQTNKKQQFKR